MKVIGLGRRTQGLAGWGLVTTDSDSSTVTGRENTAAIMIATAVMTATETMVGIEIMTAKATTIADSPRSFQTI